MDLLTVMVWVVVIGLGYLGGRWYKTGRSIEDLGRSIQRSLREALGAADTEEVQSIRMQLSQVQNQVDARFTAWEIQQGSTPTQPRVSGENLMPKTLEQVENICLATSPQPLSPSVHSTVWQGLRFTLGEALWAHAGTTNSAHLTDEQLAVMIQGPFCPACLKRWIGREVPPTSPIPDHCRFCGIPWVQCQSYDRPVQAREVKRLVYEYLDREMRDQFPVSTNNGPI